MAQSRKTAPDRRGIVIDALMGLAAERRWGDIALADIADRAGLSLGQLRELFASKGAIVAGLARQTDQAVLESIDASVKPQLERDRLSQVLWRRLTLLAPYKAGLKELYSALRYDPLALSALNRTLLTSMQWMLAAAAIESEGGKGAVRAQGLVVAWSRILGVWFEDDSDDLRRTRAEIDRRLQSGEWWLQRLTDIWALMQPLCQMLDGARRRGTAKRPDGIRDPDSAGRHP